MKELPALPRSDPDNPNNNSVEQLATGQWLASDKAIRALSIQENDPDSVNPVVLGRLDDDEGTSHLISFDDDRHMVSVAGSRAGKGNSLIIPNLLFYKGSVVCIDPKGENASVTAKYRRDSLGQKVYVLDPYRVASVPDDLRATFNPLNWIDPEDKEVTEDAALLAESMIISDKSKDPHWDESARTFIKGLILLILTLDDPALRRFSTLFEFASVGFNSDEDDLPSIDDLLDLMQGTDDFDGSIAAVGASLSQMGDNERGSVFSTTRRNIEFLESPSIQENLHESSFNPSDFNTSESGVTLYIVLPEWRLSTHSRWMRMVINSLLQSFQRTPKTSSNQPATLFILEEFASLGYLQSIERASGYIAGFGVKLWSILQDLNQLKDIYPTRWETFLGNAGILTAFGNVDKTTLEYLSSRTGQVEITRMMATKNFQNSNSETSQSMWQALQSTLNSDESLPTGFMPQSESTSDSSSVSYAPQLHLSPLILPDEISRYFSRERGLLLALISGLSPMRLHRIVTHTDPVFAPRADENPYHRSG